MERGASAPRSIRPQRRRTHSAISSEGLLVFFADVDAALSERVHHRRICPHIGHGLNQDRPHSASLSSGFRLWDLFRVTFVAFSQSALPSVGPILESLNPFF